MLTDLIYISFFGQRRGAVLDLGMNNVWVVVLEDLRFVDVAI